MLNSYTHKNILFCYHNIAYVNITSVTIIDLLVHVSTGEGHRQFTVNQNEVVVVFCPYITQLLNKYYCANTKPISPLKYLIA